MKDKTDSSVPESSEHNVPFFARFLEGQDTSKSLGQTLKYPSDRDEWPEQRFGYISGND
jgi:hypothetical protein